MSLRTWFQSLYRRLFLRRDGRRVVQPTGRSGLALEQLEARELMAGDIKAVLLGDLLQVQGSAQSDQIHVGQSGNRINVHDRTSGALLASAAVADVRRISILGNGGDDVLSVDTSVQASVELFGGAGNDRFQVIGGWANVRDREVGDALVEMLQASVTRTSESASETKSTNLVDKLLEKEIIAYKYTTSGAMTLNLMGQSYYAELDLGAGVKIDSTAFQTILETLFQASGPEASKAVPIPKVDPIQAMAATLGVKMHASNNYDAVRQDLYTRYGAENVFFSSERFVEWASPETASRLGAVLVAGAATGQGKMALDSAVAELKRVGSLEWADISSWFKANTSAPNQAIPEYPLLAAKAVESLFQAGLKEMSQPGQKGPMVLSQTVLEGGELSIHFLPVNYSSDVEHRWVPGVTGEMATPQHLSYAIVWTPRPGLGNPAMPNPLKTTRINPMEDAAVNFDEHIQTSTAPLDVLSDLGSDTFVGMLFEPGALTDLVKNMTNASGSSIHTLGAEAGKAAINQLVFKSLAGVLDIRWEGIKGYVQAGNPLVDLTGTDIANRLEKFLQMFAQGNRSSVRITQFELNLNDYSVSVQFDLNHKHSWGTVADVAGAILDTVDGWADKATDTVDRYAESLPRSLDQTAQQVNRQIDQLATRAGDTIGQVHKDMVEQQKAWLQTIRRQIDHWEADANQDFKEWTGDFRERVVDWFGNRADGIFDSVKDSLNSWNQTGKETIVDWFGERVESLQDWVSDKLDDVTPRGIPGADQLIRSFTSQMSAAGREATRAIDRVEAGLKSTLKQAVSEVQTAINAARREVEKGLRNEANALKNLIQPAIRQAKQLLAAQMDLAEKALTAQSQAFDKVLSTAVAGLRQTLRTQLEAGRAVLRESSGVALKAVATEVRLARDMIHLQTDLARQLANRMIEEARQRGPVTDLDALKREVQQKVNATLKETGKTLAGMEMKAREAVSKAQESMRQAVTKAETTVNNAINETRKHLREKLNAAKQTVTTAWKKIQREAEKQVDKVRDQLIGKLSSAKKVADRLVRDAKDDARDALNEAKRFVREAIATAKDSARDAYYTARDRVNNLVRRARDEVNGLERRLREEAERLARQAAEAAARAAQAAANAAARAVSSAGNSIRKKLRF